MSSSQAGFSSRSHIEAQRNSANNIPRQEASPNSHLGRSQSSNHEDPQPNVSPSADNQFQEVSWPGDVLFLMPENSFYNLQLSFMQYQTPDYYWVYVPPQYFSSVTFFQTSPAQQNQELQENKIEDQPQPIVHFPQQIYSNSQNHQINEQINQVQENLNLRQSLKDKNLLSMLQEEMLEKDKLIEAYQSLLPMFNCPISQQTMTNPYILTSCGHTFEKRFIERWVSENNNCPLCETWTHDHHMVPNLHLQNIITKFMSIKNSRIHMNAH